jgi:hypothetical protein
MKDGPAYTSGKVKVDIFKNILKNIDYDNDSKHLLLKHFSFI